MRRSNLKRPDPEKVREFLNRSRKPLASGNRKQRKRVPQEVRTSVKVRSGGYCIVCLHREGLTAEQGKRLSYSMARRRGIGRAAHLHHVLPVQTWPGYELERLNMVGVCPACHDNHERAHVRIPRAALGRSVLVWVRSRGQAARDYVSRTYP